MTPEEKNLLILAGSLALAARDVIDANSKELSKAIVALESKLMDYDNEIIRRLDNKA